MGDGPRWRWSNVPLPESHLALLGMGLLLDLLRPWRIGVAGRVGGPIGWLLVVLGSGAAAWSTVAAGSDHLARPDRLVVSGPYALSRHPMYVGWTLVYAGLTLARRSAWLLVLLPALLALVRRTVQGEEGRLEERFGAEYRAYRDGVPRYL